MKRDRILERLKKAAGNGQPVELPSFPDFPRVTDPIQTFKERLESVQGTLLPGSTQEERITAFEEVLTGTNSTSICWENADLFENYRLEYCWIREPVKQSPVCSFHPRSKFTLPLKIDLQPRDRQSLSEIEVSVSEGLWAIAETGSILESTGPGKSRILPILAPNHVIILKKSRILGTQGDFFQIPDLGRNSSAQVIMTGPSRTADIEKVLALGVHGPKKLFVILV